MPVKAKIKVWNGNHHIHFDTPNDYQTQLSADWVEQKDCHIPGAWINKPKQTMFGGKRLAGE